MEHLNPYNDVDLDFGAIAYLMAPDEEEEEFDDDEDEDDEDEDEDEEES